LLPILESLKRDSSDSVRRSVANNLNDISKDNPEFVISLVKKWQGVGSKTDALIKHACRTLLKQGNTEVLRIFGYRSQGLLISDFTLVSARVEFGSSLEFSFSISNNASRIRKVRIEYAIYHLKKNGELTPRVFMVSEREMDPGSQTRIERKHKIKPITTRRYYPGLHRVAVIINGVETAPLDFLLEM